MDLPSQVMLVIYYLELNMIKEPVTKVNRDAYFIITVENTDGFKFSIASRGYNLKSWNKFHAGLSNVKKTSIKEVSEKVYTKKLWGI